MIGSHWQIAPVSGPGPGVPTIFGRLWDFDSLATGTNPAGDFGTTVNTAAWMFTNLTSAMPLLLDDILGGVIRCINAGTTNHAVSAQLNGSPFLITAGKTIQGLCKVRTSAIAGTAFAFGLAVKDSTVILTNTTFAITPSDFIGIKCIDGAGTLLGVVRGASGTETTVNLGLALVNATFKELSFEVKTDGAGASVAYFYVNGALAGKITSSQIAFPLATVGLSPCWEAKTMASTANNVDLDWIGHFQER